MGHRFLTNFYIAIPSTLFVISMLCTMRVGYKFFEHYSYNRYEAQHSLSRVKFARTPVLNFESGDYAVLAINYHPDNSKKAVIIRDLATNKIGSFRAGQKVHGGPVIRAINPESITLFQDSHTVIVSLPRS